MPVDVIASDYVKLIGKLKTVDRKVKRAMLKRIREAAGPIGRHVLATGSAKMPSRGGLSDRLARDKTTTAVRGTGVDIWLGNKRRSQINRINRLGLVRHPVWGRAWWSDTKVLAGTYGDAFQQLPPEDRANLAKVLDDIMKELK